MEQEKIQELIMKYNEGQADPSEIKMIEHLIENGTIELSQLQELKAIEEQMIRIESPFPSTDLDDRFYKMLRGMKKEGKGFSWASFFSWPELAPKLAFASVALVVGFFAGYLFMPSPQSKEEIKIMSQEISDLKEMMMFSLLEKESATDRLKAVSLTSEMSPSEKVTSALLKTLNADDNINVRLAALDALKPYANNSKVREELVRSIANQESPLVQVAMADLMVALQEKSSVKELEKILKNERTPKEVKKRIEENIKTMI
ncbi:MAG TPA: HEAT repeat domain-containing protein [Cyclobacteriaceae bacterium]|nr:HEAT repeat domain-containing protein [Cyclobacteriaceae bacterium]